MAPETRFFIGSTTKAFTATLVGMLVDEGTMRWDDPADRHLPYFKLAVASDDPTARATLRDLLSHRTGFPRMSMLLASGVLPSEEILRQAPFRQLESNEQLGRTVYEVERVELDVEVDEEMFILRPAEPPVAAATVVLP